MLQEFHKQAGPTYEQVSGNTPIPRRLYIYSGGPAVNLLSSPGESVQRLSEIPHSVFDDPNKICGLLQKHEKYIGREPYHIYDDRLYLTSLVRHTANNIGSAVVYINRRLQILGQASSHGIVAAQSSFNGCLDWLYCTCTQELGKPPHHALIYGF